VSQVAVRKLRHSLETRALACQGKECSGHAPLSPATQNPYGEPGVILEQELQEPRLYRVLLHNDNYTTMEFVIGILVEVFHKSAEQAADIMLAVHEQGTGVCGVYPHEVAETKVVMVHNLARRAGFPLKSTMEEVG
jgi:ATP-dependent Clp protease adaptor protein ClpS